MAGTMQQATSLNYDKILENYSTEKEIIINGQTLIYREEGKIPFRLGPIEESDAKELFHKTKELFDAAGIEFSLVYGSLLGAVREGKMIKGDGDMDIFIWDEKKLRDNLIQFYDKGLKVCRILGGVRYSFRINTSCYIDVYTMRELKGLSALLWGRSCIAISGCETPRKFFTGWTEIEFFGEKCKCPENPERLLEFWYGSDWTIPKSKKGIYRVKSAHYIYSTFDGRYFRYFCNIFKMIYDSQYRKKILKRLKESGTFFNDSV